MGESGELWSDLESVVRDSLRSAKESVERLGVMRGKALQTALKEIEDDLDACRMNILEMEQMNRNGKKAGSFTQDIRAFKDELSTIKSEYEMKKETAQKGSLMITDHSRSIGYFADGGGPYVSRDEQAQRLKKSSKQESANTRLLMDAHQSALDAEKTAIGTLDELHKQRNTLERIKYNLSDGNSVMSRMGRTLGRMRRRQILMSLAGCFVILLLAGLIALIVYVTQK